MGFARKSFSTKALYFHYKSMCKNNYLKYLKSGADVTYKKYLYAMRGLLNARWVAQKGTLPPIGFMETLAGLDGIIPEHILARLRTIITLKARGKEKEILQNIGPFDAYIESFLGDDSEVPPEKTSRDLALLDAELRKIVLRR